MVFVVFPTACAVGCILAPLRGWIGDCGRSTVCGWVSFGGFCRAAGTAEAAVLTGFWVLRFGMFGQVLCGVVGDFVDHVAGTDLKVDVAGISYGDVQSFEDDVGALVVDVAFEDGVDHVHDGGLDGFGVFDQGDGVDLRVDASLHTLDHAGVEVAEIFLLERGGTAAVSGDFYVGALTNVWMNGHGYIPRNSRFSPKSMI